MRRATPSGTPVGLRRKTGRWKNSWMRLTCPKRRGTRLWNREADLLGLAFFVNLDKQNFIVDENNFDFFQSYFEQIFCLGGKAEDKFNPANAAAQKIAEKLMRGRRIVAEQKRTKNGNKNVSILSQYTSILSVGLHIPLQDLLDLTIYQLYDLVERYRLWAAWDIDTRARLAGANPESQPDDWMKNLH